MAERADGATWVRRGVFLAVIFVLMIAELVPLDLRPQTWAAPDLILLVTLAWIVRKPSYVPLLVVAAIFLLADMLFMRPPGLWAALVVLLTEAIRRQNREFRDMPAAMEWATVAFGIIVITALNRLVLAIVVAPQAPLGLTLIEMSTTIIAYPLVVLIGHYLFGITRVAPGEVGRRGQRL